MPAIDIDVEALRVADHAPIRSWREVAQALYAWCLLALVDAALMLGNFDRFRRVIAAWPMRGTLPEDRRAAAVKESCAAVNRARRYYVKRVQCLQCAAATVCFLRLHGGAAQLVIGIRKIPFKAHAWAEFDGVVVNDFPSVQTSYTVMLRC